MATQHHSESRPDLAKRVLARERDAVSLALNLIDDQRPGPRAEALALLSTLERATGDAGGLRVGITGTPGAGKSTLIDALVRGLRRADRTVGIVAVDPSSQRSGGALLGDRLRVRSGAADPGVFLRSMAARDRLGGLADATRAGVEVLAASFDEVLVETVGVGQSECDVAQLVDTLVLVAQPGAGDMLQYMKAGLLELPDVYAVNKADMGATAERTAGELEAGIGISELGDAAWRPPILLVSARDGTGVPALLDAIDAHRTHLEQTGGLARRRAAQRRAFVREALLRRYGTHGIERLGGTRALAERLADVDALGCFSVIARVGDEIEQALAGS